MQSHPWLFIERHILMNGLDPGSDVLHHLSDCLHPINLPIRNIQIELRLDSHHEIDHVDRIGAQIPNKKYPGIKTSLINTEFGTDDLKQTVFRIHNQPLSSVNIA